MENTVGEMENKKSFVGGYDSPIRTGGGVNYITSKDLNDPEEMYQVGTPVFDSGVDQYIAGGDKDTTNSSTDLNQSYDQTNRSAKYKNPNVKQSTSQMPKEPTWDEPNI